MKYYSVPVRQKINCLLSGEVFCYASRKVSEHKWCSSISELIPQDSRDNFFFLPLGLLGQQIVLVFIFSIQNPHMNDITVFLQPCLLFRDT